MSTGTELAALVAVAQAIVAAGPSEIRASMGAVESTAQALAGRAAKSLFETAAAAPADLDLAERCTARAQWYLCELDEHEMRGHSAADRAEALDRESRHQARGGEPQPGRLAPRVPTTTPNYSSARGDAESALRSAETVVDAFHEAGLPAFVAHWTARCVEIEHRALLLRIASEGTSALGGARIVVDRIAKIIKEGGLTRRCRSRTVTSPGTRKVPEYRRRALWHMERALDLLWSPEACAADDDPIIIAMRAEYEVVRAQVDACPSRMPGKVAA